MAIRPSAIATKRNGLLKKPATELNCPASAVRGAVAAVAVELARFVVDAANDDKGVLPF